MFKRTDNKALHIFQKQSFSFILTCFSLQRKILEKKLSENLLFKEFEETPKKIPEYDCNVAKLPENASRNRFKDVLPYDGTRVKLNPRKDNSSGYINASHIKVSCTKLEILKEIA